MERTMPFFKIRPSEFPRREAALVALSKYRKNGSSKVGDVGEVPLAAEKLATKLGFELLYGVRQRRLRDMTLLCGSSEVKRLANGQQIADLV
jgi:hypothetical protein